MTKLFNWMLISWFFSGPAEMSWVKFRILLILSSSSSDYAWFDNKHSPPTTQTSAIFLRVSPSRLFITLKSKETHNTALAHHKMYYGLCKIKKHRIPFYSAGIITREHHENLKICGIGGGESRQKDLPTELAVNLHHLLDFSLACLPSKHPPNRMCTNICWFTLNFHWGIKTHLHCKY